MSTYRQTILACKEAEQNLWKIGDALLADISDETELKQQLKEAATELAKVGLNYTSTYLGIIRKTAKQFTSNQRRNDVPFHIHRLACTIENLDTIIEYAKKTESKLTAHLVRSILRHMRELEVAERRKLKDAAAAERRQAVVDKKAAIRILKGTTDATIIEAATLEKKRAEKAYAEAIERENNVKIAPQVRKIPIESLRPIVAKAGLMLAAEEARLQASNAFRVLNKDIDQLPPEIITAMLDGCVEVMQDWQRNANMLRRKQYQPGSHLAAVN